MEQPINQVRQWVEMIRDKDNILQYVKEYKPESANIKHLRILLYGPVGAGKSSFINSVDSIIRGEISTPASVNAAHVVQSFTKKYETHSIRKGRGNEKTFYPFVFNDIMGLEKGYGVGARVDDIKLALEGHVMDGYKFNPVAPLENGDLHYISSPTPDDKVHVLVCVLSANSPEISESVLQKMTEIRQKACNLGIPQMAIITHVDTACPETEKDLQDVYKSKHVKKKMKDFSAAVGIPMTCIFPVKNYSEEINIDEKVDTLILSALKTMIRFGDNFIEKLVPAASENV